VTKRSDYALQLLSNYKYPSQWQGHLARFSAQQHHKTVWHDVVYLHFIKQLPRKEANCAVWKLRELAYSIPTTRATPLPGTRPLTEQAGCLLSLPCCLLNVLQFFQHLFQPPLDFSLALQCVVESLEQRCDEGLLGPDQVERSEWLLHLQG
jgi:hypothetical protein